MGIARKVRQERRHLGLRRTVFHARHVSHIRRLGAIELFAGPHGMLRRHAVAVGHASLHFGNVLVRQREVVGHHIAQIQQERCHRIHLVRGQRFGRSPGHGAVDVIPHSGQCGHFHESSPTRRRVLQLGNTAILHVFCGSAPHQRAEHFTGVAKHTVTMRALGFPDVLTFGHAAGSRWQSFEVGAHIDVPRCHFLGSGSATHAGVFVCGLRQRHPRCSHHCSCNHCITKAGHFSPRHFPEPAMTESRCCDRSNVFRAQRATVCRWAARSLCHRSHGSG